MLREPSCYLLWVRRGIFEACKGSGMFARGVALVPVTVGAADQIGSWR